MGDQKKTDDLDGVDGGFSQYASPGDGDGVFTDDPLEDVGGGAGSPSGSDDESLENLGGGKVANQMSAADPLENVDGGSRGSDSEEELDDVDGAGIHLPPAGEMFGTGNDLAQQ